MDSACWTILDSLVGDVEEPFGLDGLHALVHQGGAVDGDLVAHVPGRVVEGLLGGDVGELVCGEMAQSAARGGEQDAADLVAAFAPEALPDGGVLGVDGPELSAASVDGVADELSGHDDDFLVGQGDGSAALEGGEGGFEPGASGGADDEDVAVGIGGHLVHGGESAAAVGCDLRQSGSVVGCSPDVSGVELVGLGLEGVEVSSGGESKEVEAAGHCSDDIEGLSADAAG